jgi:hypothetical protein
MGRKTNVILARGCREGPEFGIPRAPEAAPSKPALSHK